MVRRVARWARANPDAALWMLAGPAMLVVVGVMAFAMGDPRIGYEGTVGGSLILALNLTTITTQGVRPR